MTRTTTPPTVEIVDVTPAMAADWLALNMHNRHARRNVLTGYAADMSDGHWQFNGDTIRFCEDGSLLDGQHRLAALIDADITLPMIIVRGLAATSQETMDGGAKRKFGDVLKLRGESNSEHLSAILRRVTLWEAGSRKSENNMQPTNAQMSATLDKYGWLRDILHPARSIADACGLTPSVVGVCWWLFSRIDQDDCEGFMTALRYGENLQRRDPIYELRGAIDRTRSGPYGSRSPVYLIAITIKAWNAYREGRKVQTISYRAGGANPDKYPEPV